MNISEKMQEFMQDCLGAINKGFAPMPMPNDRQQDPTELDWEEYEDAWD